jgi:hypothetical protein
VDDTVFSGNRILLVFPILLDKHFVRNRGSRFYSPPFPLSGKNGEGHEAAD